MVFFQYFEINTWTPIIISLFLGKCDELDQVFISIEIFRKKDYFEYFIIFITIGSSFFRELELDSDDRLDPLSSTCLIELKSSIHIPSIRDRNSRLSKLSGSLGETFWSRECSLEGIMSVCMKMDKRHGRSLWKNRFFASRKCWVFISTQFP